MNNPKKNRQRRDRVLKMFQDREWGNVELLDGWDGHDIEELRSVLDEEEFQALLDHLADLEDRER